MSFSFLYATEVKERTNSHPSIKKAENFRQYEEAIYMFGNIFGRTKPKLPMAVEITVMFVRAAQFELGDKQGAILSLSLAQNPRFIGAILGIVDYACTRKDNSVPHIIVAEQVMEVIFGQNSNIALDIVHNGVDIPAVIDETMDTSEFLEHVFSLPHDEQVRHIPFLTKFLS
jgi:hypothetical protein